MEKPTSTSDLERFAQLTHNSSRAKISVLLLLLVSLFIVWSTLKSGTIAAEQVDKDFCLKIIKDPYYGPFGHLGDASCSSYPTTQITINSARHVHDDDAPYPKTMGEAEIEQHLQDFLDHLQQFQGYDWNRRQAYSLPLSLPYAKSSVPLDGLLVSDVWPFWALLALSVALAFGFRQACYQIHLSALVADIEPGENQARDVALTEFQAAEISETNLNGRPVVVYKRPIGLFPERTISGLLFLAVSLLSLNLLTDYSPQFTPRGEQLFADSYYIWIYLFAVVLGCLLIRTRRLWRRSLTKALGGEVRNARLIFLDKALRSVCTRTILGIRWETILVSILALAGLGSLFIKWADFRGLALVWHPDQVFDDEPLAARVVQGVMILAIVFSLASLLSRLPRASWSRKLIGVAQKGRRLGAWITLLIGGFVIFYTVVGLYGFVKDEYVGPAVAGFNYEALLNLENLPTLGDADFSLGFTTFTASLSALALIELLLQAEDKKEEKAEPRATDGG
jgi:hypothetical protein